MAQIEIKTNVTAPSEISIQLVRADYAATENVFRIFFEVFLSIFSTLLGFVLSLQNVAFVHWLFLGVCGVASSAFLLLTIFYSRESKKVG
jgi:hypothetical protein